MPLFLPKEREFVITQEFIERGSKRQVRRHSLSFVRESEGFFGERHESERWEVNRRVPSGTQQPSVINLSMFFLLHVCYGLTTILRSRALHRVLSSAIQYA
jgi:hypothetical protein